MCRVQHLKAKSKIKVLRTYVTSTSVTSFLSMSIHTIREEENSLILGCTECTFCMDCLIHGIYCWKFSVLKIASRQFMISFQCSLLCVHEWGGSWFSFYFLAKFVLHGGFYELGGSDFRFFITNFEIFFFFTFKFFFHNFINFV